MRYTICVPLDKSSSSFFVFNLDFHGAVKRVVVPDVCIINLFKIHDHRYDLEAFFYSTQFIFSRSSFSTKKKLYDVIQKLLQEFL